MSHSLHLVTSQLNTLAAKLPRSGNALIRLATEVGRMIRILLAAAILGAAAFTDLAMAQGKPGEASGSDVSSLVAKLEAQCAHRRRTMPPDPGDECARKLRDAQLATGVAGAANGAGQAGLGIGAGPGNGTGNGIGPGNGAGNGIGPGSGGGLAKGKK